MKQCHWHSIVIHQLELTVTAVGKGKVHPCTGTEALYRPYGP
jgi:hypothetical protein